MPTLNRTLLDSSVSKTFRPYQEDVIDVVGRGPNGLAKYDWLIEMPTGAGKTTIAIAILADLLGSVFAHAIVVAPMTQIEDGFVVRTPTSFAWQDETRRIPLEIPAGFVRAARDGSQESTCREIIEYLSAKNPGYALATTHAALSCLVRDHSDEIRAKLKGCLLVVDEAHRAPAKSESNALSKAVKFWSERKGRLLYLTATPHRTDGLPVKPEGMREYRRSMAEHSEGGLYSPEKFQHGIVLYGPDDIELTWKQLTGQELHEDARVISALAARMVQEWLSDGRPKAIVFVPPIRGGSAESIRTIIEAFQAVGARTLDASGVGKGNDGIKHQARFLDALRAERGLTSYRQSQFDVIVGGPRLPEGTDWPFCSMVYSVGVSGSMRETVQLMGRATRFKGQVGYPKRHRNTATMKSFVSAATGKALEKMSLEHSRLVLVTCVFMADYQAATGFVLTKAVREALNGGKTLGVDVVPLEPVHVAHGLDDQTYAMVKLAMAAKIKEDPRATHGALWDAGRKAAPDAPDGSLDVIVAGFISTGKDKDRAEKFIREKIGPEMQDIDGALRAMVEEFREVQAGAVAELEAIGVQVHAMTGVSMQELVNIFSEYTKWSEGLILEKSNEYFAIHNKPPSRASGNMPNMEVTWGAADHWLRTRGKSLSRLLGNRDTKWSEEFIRGNAETYKKVHGKYPTGESGKIAGEKITWGAADHWLRNRGSSLPKLLGRQRVSWSIDFILEKSNEYFAARGSKPCVGSGRVSGMNGTWGAANSWLRTQGTSLAILLKKKTFWSPGLIRKKSEEYRAIHGSYPHLRSGKIPEMGVTWGAADHWLRRINTTLSRFLKDTPIE